MLIFKKLIFALPFLIFFVLFCFSLNSFLKNSDALFTLDLKEILNSVYLVLYLLLASLFFIIFSTLSEDIRLVLPVVILGSSICLLFAAPINLILYIGFIISFLIIYFPFENKLKNYLTFKATSLLIPYVKTLTTFIILVSSLAFYLFISEDLKLNGFQIPDSIVDPVINITSSNLPDQTNQLSIPQDQINLLKQNPELLKTYNLDPKILDQITTSKPQGISQNDLIKSAVNSQVNSLIEPNLGILGVVLTVIFFVSLNFLASFLILFFYPLVSLIFWILEKTKFISFTVENRPVKKLII